MVLYSKVIWCVNICSCIYKNRIEWGLAISKLVLDNLKYTLIYLFLFQGMEWGADSKHRIKGYV